MDFALLKGLKQAVLRTAVFGSMVALSASAHAQPTVRTAIDPMFGLPTPPRDAPFGLEASLYTGLVLGLIGIAVQICAVYDARRTRSVLPIFVALSGVFCVIPEVFIDVAGACFWPFAEGHVVFTALGRPMTWFPIVAWFAFGSVLVYLPYALLLRNAATKSLWGALAFTCVFDIVIEEVMLNTLGLYVYYGHQPMIFFTKFPAWWMFTNSVGVFLGAALA